MRGVDPGLSQCGQPRRATRRNYLNADAVEKAPAKHGCPQIFNTDQGSQFTSAEFTGVLINNISISMDGKGLPLVEEFTPSDGEDRLYELVSEYLRRDNLQALPASQRSLMTLVLRKLLASSTFAIAGALSSISKRMQAKLKKHEIQATLEEDLGQDYESLDATAEEWTETDRARLEL